MSSHHRYRIFISSPGDMQAERRIAREVITRVDESLPGIALAPYFSDDSIYFAHQGPQEGIPLSSQFDLVICLFWKRIGTLLLPEKFNAPDGRRRTGSEFEFETAVDAARRSQEHGGTPVPGVLVYRKSAREISIPDHDQEYAQYRALEEFFLRWVRDEQGHYLGYANRYDSAQQFGRMLERHLRDWLTLQRRAVDWDIATRGSPFRGLQVFDRSHESVFFGRDRAILEARARLKKAAEDGFAALWIVGASGSGKSSLLRAGLLPSLERSEGDLRCLMFKPGELGQDLCAGLAALLLDTLPELRQGSFPDMHNLAKLLAAQTPDLALQALRVALDAWAQAEAVAKKLDQPPHTRLLLAIDQAEELLTLRSAAERSWMVLLLKAWVESDRVWLALSFRSDFYATLQRDGRLLPLKQRAAQLDIAELSPAEITQIISEPCRAAGLTLETREDGAALLDELSKDAGAADSLPMLQFALQALFERAQARQDQTLRLRDYADMDRAAGALSTAAEAVFKALPPAVQDAFPRLLRELVDLNLQAVNRAPTAKSCALSRFADDASARELITALSDPRQRLLSEFDIDGVPQVRVVHESLLRHWPRAQEQIAQDARRLDARRRLQESAALWAAAQSKKDKRRRLLTGLDLQEGLDLAGAWDLAPDLSSFIRHSRVAQKNREGRRFVGVLAIFVVLLSALYLGVEAGRQQARAQQSEADRLRDREEAANRASGRAEQELQAGNRAGWQAYLAEALTYSATPGRIAAASMALQQSDGSALRQVFEYRSTDPHALYSPDGTRVVVSAGEENAVKIVDTHTDRQIGEPLRHESPVVYAMFTPDGAKVVTFDAGKKARVWRADTAESLAKPIDFGNYDFINPKRIPVFSADGSHMAKADVGRAIKVFDLRKASVVANISGEHPVDSMQFSPDATRLLVVANGKVHIWRLADSVRTDVYAEGGYISLAQFSPNGRLLITKLALGGAQIWSVGGDLDLKISGKIEDSFDKMVFSPDSAQLVTIRRGRNVRIIETGTGQAIARQPSSEISAISMSFSPDGRRLLLKGHDRSIRVWDLRRGAMADEPLRHDEDMTSAFFAPDSAHIVTVSVSGTVRRWDVRAGASVGFWLAGNTVVETIRFGPDGRRVLTVDYRNEVRIWDAYSGAPIGTRIESGQRISIAEFNADGSIVVTGGRDGSVRLWDAKAGTPIGRPRLHGHEVRSVELSQGGTRLLTLDTKMVARLWQVKSGEIAEKPIWEKANIGYFSFSEDGNLFVTWGEDSVVRMFDSWDAEAINRPIAVSVPSFSAANQTDTSPGLFGARDQLLVAWEGEDAYADMMRRRRKDANAERFRDPPSRLETQFAAMTKSAIRVNAPVQFSPDGLHIAVAGDKARVLPIEEGLPVFLGLEPDETALSVCFSPDGKLLATTGGKDTVTVWDAHSGARISRFSREEAISLQFSPNSSRLLVSGGWSARMFDAYSGLPTGDSVNYLQEHGYVDFFDYRIARIGISPDGGRVATVYSDKAVRIIDTHDHLDATPQELALALQMSGGKEVDVGGRLTDISAQKSFAWRHQILSRTANSSRFERLAHWLVSDRGERSVSPFSEFQVSQHIENEIDRVLEDEFAARQANRDGLESARLAFGDPGPEGYLQAVYEIDPSHPLILLALAMLEGDTETRRLWLKLTLPRLKNDVRIAIKAAEILRRDEDPEYAGKAAQIALDLEPRNERALAVMRWVREQAGKKSSRANRKPAFSYGVQF